jgi:hypothetical protein
MIEIELPALDDVPSRRPSRRGQPAAPLDDGRGTTVRGIADARAETGRLLQSTLVATVSESSRHSSTSSSSCKWNPGSRVR